MDYMYVNAGWVIVVAVALTAPIVLLRVLKTPVPTMSESIRDVLR